MKALISESKLFPSMLSLFAVKRRQVCEGIQINLLSNQIGTLCRSLEGNNTRLVCVQMNKGGTFLKKLWCCVGGRVQQVPYRSDEGLTLETSATLFYPLRWSVYIFNSVVNTKLPDLCSAENERDGNAGNCYE